MQHVAQLMSEGLQDVRLPGSHVDVNMHPTKREVGFLHQDELVQTICSALEAQLLASDSQCAPTQMLAAPFTFCKLLGCALAWQPCTKVGGLQASTGFQQMPSFLDTAQLSNMLYVSLLLWKPNQTAAFFCCNSSFMCGRHAVDEQPRRNCPDKSPVQLR